MARAALWQQHAWLNRQAPHVQVAHALELACRAHPCMASLLDPLGDPTGSTVWCSSPECIGRSCAGAELPEACGSADAGGAVSAGVADALGTGDALAGGGGVACGTAIGAAAAGSEGMGSARCASVIPHCSKSMLWSNMLPKPVGMCL